MSNFLVIRRPKRRFEDGLRTIGVFVSAKSETDAKRKAVQLGGEEMQPAYEYNKSMTVYAIEDGKVLYF